MNSQKGFTAKEIFIIVILLLLFGVWGYYVLFEPTCENTAPFICITETIRWDGNKCECSTNQHFQAEWTP